MSVIVFSIPYSGFWLGVVLPKSGFADVRDLYPLGIGRSLGAVVVVPVPPLVCWRLGITLGRVLPKLLTAERCHIEVAPNTPHGLVAAGIDEVRAKDFVAVV